jgi:hypothetical protein
MSPSAARGERGRPMSPSAGKGRERSDKSARALELRV